MLKRFLVLAGDANKLKGGFTDFLSSHSLMEDALDSLNSFDIPEADTMWGEIIDTAGDLRLSYIRDKPLNWVGNGPPITLSRLAQLNQARGDKK